MTEVSDCSIFAACTLLWYATCLSTLALVPPDAKQVQGTAATEQRRDPCVRGGGWNVLFLMHAAEQPCDQQVNPPSRTPICFSLMAAVNAVPCT